MHIPNKCPACGGKVRITELRCSGCDTTVKGSFHLPHFAELTPAEDKFLRIFLASRGSIKEVGRRLGISYPTVRGRLDSLLNRLGLGNVQAEARLRRIAIVEKLERGEVTAREAIVLLKNLEK